MSIPKIQVTKGWSGHFVSEVVGTDKISRGDTAALAIVNLIKEHRLLDIRICAGTDNLNCRCHDCQARISKEFEMELA